MCDKHIGATSRSWYRLGVSPGGGRVLSEPLIGDAGLLYTNCRVSGRRAAIILVLFGISLAYFARPSLVPIQRVPTVSLAVIPKWFGNPTRLRASSVPIPQQISPLPKGQGPLLGSPMRVRPINALPVPEIDILHLQHLKQLVMQKQLMMQSGENVQYLKQLAMQKQSMMQSGAKVSPQDLKQHIGIIAKAGKNALAGYNNAMIKDPAAKKIMTSTIGDLYAQNIAGKNLTNYDLRRTVRSAMGAAIGQGPVLNYWLNSLDESLSSGAAYYYSSPDAKRRVSRLRRTWRSIMPKK